MAISFGTVQSSDPSARVKMLVYGSSGIGKTVLSATLPNPVLISAEAGTLSLRKANLERLYGVNAPGITYNMPVITIKTIEDLHECYSWLVQSKEAQNFESVAIDSLSEIAEVVLTTAKKGLKDPRQAYQQLLERMEEIIRYFRDLPSKHVYMSAKMEPIKDELTGVVKYGPSMPGAKLAVKLPYFFDEFFRLGLNKTQQGETYRYIQTQPDLQYEAKDRSGILELIEVPNLGQIITKIQLS